jgi:four helix bundle protein
MNDPEVTMLQPAQTTHHGLQAHDIALEAAGIVLRIAARVPAPLKSLADQAIRAASSVPLNLAEGQGRRGRDRCYHWRIAYGSALEVGSALNLLKAAGAVDDRQVAQAMNLFDRVRAMTWRLLHPRT